MKIFIICIGIFLGLIFNIIYIWHGKPELSIDSISVGGLSFLIPFLLSLLLSAYIHIRSYPDNILYNVEKKGLLFKWKIKNGINALIMAIKDIYRKDRHPFYTNIICNIINTLHTELGEERFIGELTCYTRYVENAIRQSIGRLGRKDIKVFSTSLLKPSEWLNGLGASGKYRENFQEYKIMFEQYTDIISVTRVLIMTDEEFQNEDQKILAQFIKDHESKGMCLLYKNEDELTNDPTLKKYQVDFVLIDDGNNKLVFSIDEEEILRYVPIKFQDDNANGFRKFITARDYFLKNSESAKDAFENKFDITIESALRN